LENSNNNELPVIQHSSWAAGKVLEDKTISMKHLTVDPSNPQAPTRDLPSGKEVAASLPDAKETKVHPSNPGGENASLLFVGTATTILYLFCFHMSF